MVRIKFKNGEIYEWGDGSYKDYKYDGKCFIVFGGGQSIGLYNMDNILSAEVGAACSGNAKAGNADRQCLPEKGAAEEEGRGGSGPKEEAGMHAESEGK